MPRARAPARNVPNQAVALLVSVPNPTVADTRLRAKKAMLISKYKNSISDVRQRHEPERCALKMARRAWPKRKRFRLDDLARDGNINEGTAHRAVEDARRALIVYAGAAAELSAVS